MRFYKMKNGDIVTDIHVSTSRANAIRATRMYDATHKTQCCQRRVYYDGVASRLNKAQVAVFMGQLNSALKNSVDSHASRTERFTKGKEALVGALTKLKERIHGRTA